MQRLRKNMVIITALLLLPTISRPAALLSAYKAWKAKQQYGTITQGLYYAGIGILPGCVVGNKVNRMINNPAFTMPHVRPITADEHAQLKNTAISLYPSLDNCGWKDKHIHIIDPNTAPHEPLTSAERRIINGAAASFGRHLVLGMPYTDAQGNSHNHFTIEELVAVLEHERTHSDEHHDEAVATSFALSSYTLHKIAHRLLSATYGLKIYQRNILRLLSIAPIVVAEVVATSQIMFLTEYQADAGILNANSQAVYDLFIHCLNKADVQDQKSGSYRGILRSVIGTHPIEQDRIQHLTKKYEQRQRERQNPDPVNLRDFQPDFAG